MKKLFKLPSEALPNVNLFKTPRLQEVLSIYASAKNQKKILYNNPTVLLKGPINFS